jgi:hypothetical protein
MRDVGCIAEDRESCVVRLGRIFCEAVCCPNRPRMQHDRCDGEQQLVPAAKKFSHSCAFEERGMTDPTLRLTDLLLTYSPTGLRALAQRYP